MGKIQETTINRWDGGIVNDPRDPREATAQVVSNFDVLTDPYRMRPYRSAEDGNASQSTQRIQNFAIGKLDSSLNYALFGLGVTSGTTRAEVYYKNLTQADLEDDTWDETAGNASTAGTSTNFNLFVYYERTGKFYGARDGTNIWSYDAVNTTFVDTATADTPAITYTQITNGVVHSMDTILYIGYYNSANNTSAIASNTNGTWDITALTLPAGLRPRSLTEFGNFLAIACEPVSGTTPGFGKSVVFLWDRDSSLPSETIYWSGDERLLVLNDVNGYLVGVSFAVGATRLDNRVVFRFLNGSNPTKIAEIVSSSSVSISLLDSKQTFNNRLHFYIGITLNEAFRVGVWSIGGSPENWTIIHERTLNNDTAITQSTLNMHGFLFAGDYLFQSYDVNSSTYTISKTASTSSYAATSIYESKIFNEGDASLKKQLVGVTVMFEALPTAGVVVLKYKKDEETSYTQIFSDGTDDAVSHSAVNIESSGARLPEYKEISFRVESTGGAVITGLSWQSEVVGKRNYASLK